MPLDFGIQSASSAPTTRQTMPPELSGGVYAFGGKLPMRGLSHVSLNNLDLLQADPLLLLEILPVIFPDAGLALYNILRLGNPGYDVTCINARTGNEDPEAQRLCREMLLKANRNVDSDIPGATGGPTALINALFYSVYLKGAACVETVLNETLDDLEDIVYVDPFTIDFVPRKDKRGRYRIYQNQVGNAFTAGNEVPPVPTMPKTPDGDGYATLGTANRVELNPNLVTYSSVDDTLKGRSPVAPALPLLIFWMRFYLTLQVYLHNAAFAHLDGTIKTERLLEMLPDLPDEEKEKWQENFFGECNRVQQDITDAWKNAGKLDPDGVRFHLDILEIKPIGTAQATYPVDAVQKVCKREIFNALKMLPVLMGSNEGVTETHATVQMAIFTSGLNYYQAVVKHPIERALLTGLRARGYARNVTVTLDFKTLSFEDRKRAAEAIKMEIENAMRLRDENIITQNGASLTLTGTPAAGPAPGGNADPDAPTWADGDAAAAEIAEANKVPALQESDRVKGKKNGKAVAPAPTTPAPAPASTPTTDPAKVPSKTRSKKTADAPSRAASGPRFADRARRAGSVQSAPAARVRTGIRNQERVSMPHSSTRNYDFAMNPANPATAYDLSGETPASPAVNVEAPVAGGIPVPEAFQNWAMGGGRKTPSADVSNDTMYQIKTAWDLAALIKAEGGTVDGPVAMPFAEGDLDVPSARGLTSGDWELSARAVVKRPKKS